MFVILGGNGKIGRATAHALRVRGAAVRVVIRNQAHTQAFQRIGCEVAIADLRDSAALDAAVRGATAVQVICPTATTAPNAEAVMDGNIKSLAEALARHPPATVLAISDYGAHLDHGTGITMTFHRLERMLRQVPSSLVFLRSAEHMENWGRLIDRARQTGVLPSLHHPLSKRFPTVSAKDVGGIAADLLLSKSGADPDNSSSRALPDPFIVHAEGPERYSVDDVARIMGGIFGRAVVARELDRDQWVPALTGGGLSASYAELVAAMFEAHNAGRIDTEPGVGIVRHGDTSLQEALRDTSGFMQK